MKRQLLFPILFLLCFWCSCTETLDYIAPDSQVCVNAIMDATSGYNKIYCTRLEGSKSCSLNNASIQLFCNGELVETVSSMPDEPGTFVSKATFHPGDLVRLELVSSDVEGRIYGETQVPFPVQITSVDTLSLIQSFSDSRSESCCRMQLELHKATSQPSYYRLMSGFYIQHRLCIAEVDYETCALVTERDSITQQRTYKVNILDDLALTDGKGYVESERNDVLGYVSIYKNKFRIFSDLFFSQDSYLLTYYTVPYIYSLTPTELSFNSFVMKNPNHFLYGKRYKPLGLTEDGNHQLLLYCKDLNAKLFYDVISISAEEYHYLKGISIDDCTGNQNEPFMNPVILPCNMNNAIGIFAIEYRTHGDVVIR